ncbi:MAG: biopolymer transporter ExbD [Pirellulaceae bacterium]|jgi:biopolymer transport protein ExbD
MRRKKADSSIHEADLTPMIDMTFQLIAFFMVLINFSQSEQNDKVKLPLSDLAKPPQEVMEYPITIHVTKAGIAIIGGREVPAIGLKPLLQNEANVLKFMDKSPTDASIIIRGHREAATGKIQDIIKVCQEQGFDHFTLRAKENL